MPGLYERILGAAAADLGDPVRWLHCAGGSKRNSKGFFDIHYGKGLLSRCLAKILRLPPEGPRIPVYLDIVPHDGGERWERHFGSRSLVTEQWEQSGMLAEKVRLLEFRFRLAVENQRLVFRQKQAALRLGRWAVPLPDPMAPIVRAECWSYPSESRMQVAVQVTVPLFGELLAYKGFMETGPS